MSDNKENVPKIRFPGFTDAWEQRKLGENLVSIQTGTNLLGSETSLGIPLLKMGNIQRGYFSLNKLEYIKEEQEVESYNIAQYGDFLFNTRNTLELVGKGATWTGESGKYAFNSNIARLGFDGIDTIFFNYLYNTQQMITQVQARAVGTTSVAAVYPRDLNSINYHLPSLDEQKKIGRFFLQLDNLITLHQRKLNNVKKMKAGLLQKMFPKNGEEYPEVRFPGFTDAWEQRRLGKMGTTFTGLSGKTKEDFGHGDAKFVTYVNVFSNVISDPKGVESTGVDNKQNEVKYGDVFFTTSSETPEEVGMSSVWLENTDNVYLNSFCFGYRPTVEFDPFFLAFMLRSPRVREKIVFLAQGISRYNISKNKVMETEVPVPTLNEQRKLGAFFKHLDNLITLHQRKLEHMQELKKGLLQQMFV